MPLADYIFIQYIHSHVHVHFCTLYTRGITRRLYVPAAVDVSLTLCMHTRELRLQKYSPMVNVVIKGAIYTISRLTADEGLLFRMSELLEKNTFDMSVI